MHLHRVTDCPRRNKKRDDQGQGIKAKTNHLDKPESPNSRYNSSNSRPQCATDVVKIQIQQDPHQHGRGQKDPIHLLAVIIHPAVQGGLSGNMNDRVVIAERLDDRSHHLIKQALMINPALDKCGLQQRRFFIQRDQDAVQIGRGIHNVPDPFDIVLILGRAVHDRLDLG